MSTEFQNQIAALASVKGGQGSGNFGHSGRPGEQGGSGSGAWDGWHFDEILQEKPNEDDTPPKKNKDGNFIVYHGTSQQSADDIIASKTIKPDNLGTVGISTTPSEADIYGIMKGNSVVLELTIDKNWFSDQNIIREVGGSGKNQFLLSQHTGSQSIPPEAIKNIRIIKQGGEYVEDYQKSIKASFSGWIFNPYTREFQNFAGKKVDTSAVRKIVGEVRSGTQERLNNLAQRLQNGDLDNLAEFAIEFREEIQHLFTTSHILARGGIDEMTASDWGQLGSSLREQYDYINSMVRDIENVNIGVKDEAGEVIVRESGIPELGDGFIERVNMYTDSAWGGAGEFENVVRDREFNLGSMEMRVLGNSKQPCQDCIDATNQGWQPAGILPDIGDTECGPGCQCEFRWENEELQQAAEAFGGEIEEPEEKALKGGPGSGRHHEGKQQELRPHQRYPIPVALEELNKKADWNEAQAETKTVDIKDLIPTQGEVDGDKVNYILDRFDLGKAFVQVLDFGGKLYILDGHHTIEAAVMKGHTKIDADVITAKPKHIEKSLKGGAGSGNFGHQGRPGEIGGSGECGSVKDGLEKLKAMPRLTIKGNPKPDGDWVANPIPRTPENLENEMEDILQNDILQYAKNELMTGGEGSVGYIEKFGTVENVNLSLLESPQSIVKADSLEHFIRANDKGDEKLPLTVVQFRGHLMVRDGNTRAAAAILRGQQTAKATVVYVSEQ